ncbi:MAG: threonine ammonia-lyase, partial [Gemmatimonadales bacterium]
LTVGAVPFAALQAHRERLAGVALVDDDTIRDAMHYLYTRCRLTVEPSGAATTAALRAGVLRPLPTAPVVLVVSGGNVDPALLEAGAAHA